MYLLFPLYVLYQRLKFFCQGKCEEPVSYDFTGFRIVREAIQPILRGCKFSEVSNSFVKKVGVNFSKGQEEFFKQILFSTEFTLNYSVEGVLESDFIFGISEQTFDDWERRHNLNWRKMHSKYNENISNITGKLEALLKDYLKDFLKELGLTLFDRKTAIKEIAGLAISYFLFDVFKEQKKVFSANLLSFVNQDLDRVFEKQKEAPSLQEFSDKMRTALACAMIVWYRLKKNEIL